MAISLSNEIRALLDGPNFAHLATLMPDGSPQSAPVWVGRDGDRILICTGEGSLKAKNTRRDPRVAAGVAKGMPAATSGGPVPSPAPANLLRSLFEAGGSRCDARHNTPL